MTRPILAAVLLPLLLSACSTVTERTRGCEPYARWKYDGEVVATWLRDTDKVDVDALLLIADVGEKANNLNLCWYTSTGDSYGVLRARRADWQADYEMLFENSGSWKMIDSSERPWGPIP